MGIGVARDTVDVAYSGRDRLVAYSLVAAQAILIAGIVLVPERRDWPLPEAARIAAWTVVGLALAVGLWAAKWLGVGLTALPLPNGRVQLITNGPYRWVRHPIYSAVMLGMAAVAVMARSAAAAALAVALVVLLEVKSRWEERHLTASFPGYAAYREVTGRFVPGVGKG